jgi:hypothetical protein
MQRTNPRPQGHLCGYGLRSQLSLRTSQGLGFFLRKPPQALPQEPDLAEWDRGHLILFPMLGPPLVRLHLARGPKPIQLDHFKDQPAQILLHKAQSRSMPSISQRTRSDLSPELLNHSQGQRPLGQAGNATFELRGTLPQTQLTSALIEP